MPDFELAETAMSAIVTSGFRTQEVEMVAASSPGLSLMDRLPRASASRKTPGQLLLTNSGAPWKR